MKRLIFIFIGVFLMSFVLGYTAPSYNNINLVLENDYTAPSYNNINLVLGVASDTCTCPELGNNWEINLADYCNITANCNLSTGNITFINTGSVLFNATLTAYEIDFKDSVGVVEKYNLGSNFKGWVG